MPELTFIVDELTGALLLEGPERVPAGVLDTLTERFGPGHEVGCARPNTLLPPPLAADDEIATSMCVRVAGYYHDSLIEGPGRRSSALFQSCPLACAGCWVPHLHDPRGGSLAPVQRLAAALLDPIHERDGVSLLGGEPMVQPEGLLALVRALRARGCPHILCYSGYTYEALRRHAHRRPAIGAVLDEIDMLIDGPYVKGLAAGAGPWTGSGNQRVFTLTSGVPAPYGGDTSAASGDGAPSHLDSRPAQR